MMATYSDGPTATSTSSGATLDVTGIDAAVGDLLVLFCAADNAGTSGVSSTSTTITDAAGNTWTSQGQTNRTQASGAGDGATLSIWTCLVTNALVAATITLNFSPNTTSKAAGLQKAVPAAGCAMAVGTVGPGVTGSSSGRTSGAVSVALGMTMIGACAIEENSTVTADSDTTNGNWSTALAAVANSGTAGGSQTLTIQRKTVTATGNQTYNTATGAGRDSALNYLLVYETMSGALAATDAVDAGAFSGTVNTSAAMAPTGALDAARFVASTFVGRAGTSSTRILVRLDWPDDQVTRLWAGNGAFIDGDGEVWRGAGLIAGLDELERAVNGEAPGMTATLSGVSTETAGKVWTYYQAGNLIDAGFVVLLQPCDQYDQPQGAARTVFTGYFANAIFDDQGGEQPVSAVSAEIVNKFTLRRTPNHAVLSDTDQKARSAVLNPSDPPDRFAERMVLNENRTVVWPRYS